jgi:streptogramin lyase
MKSWKWGEDRQGAAVTRRVLRGYGARSRGSRRVPVVEHMESRRLLAVFINEFSIPTANSSPAFITNGPDGNLWFTEGNGNKIGQINPTTHSIFDFLVPTAGSLPLGIVTGPDNNLWFTEGLGNQIGTVNPSTHDFLEFPIPTANSQPSSITTGADGNLWFTETEGNNIGRIDPTTGAITEFAIPTANSVPEGIAAGSDDNIWFTESASNKIGVLSLTTFLITEFPIPTANSFPLGITSGPDDNLWFAEGAGNKIGMINPTTHAFDEFLVPTASSLPQGITTGPDANLWFTENSASQIGTINPTTHAFEEFPTPTASSQPFFGITGGPDNNIWFVERAANNIGQALINSNLIQTTTTLTSSANPSTLGQEVTFTATVTTAGQGSPNGTVTFSIDGQTQPPVLLLLVNGQQQATFTTSTLSLGNHLVNVTYDGLGLWSPSTSNTVTQVVNNNQVATTTVLASVPNPSTVGQQVTFTATVFPTGVGTPTGTVTFSIDGVAQAPVSLSLVNGQQRAILATSSLSLGSHSVMAVYNGSGGIQPSASNTVVQQVNVAPGDGPRVLMLQRFGIHSEPTTLVLTFNEALDAARAQNLANYQLRTAARRGQMIRTGRRIRISQAVFNPTTNTVTLLPAERLPLQRLFQLTVNGVAPNGLTDTQGRLLDGNGSGTPGSNYVALISQNALAGPNPST